MFTKFSVCLFIRKTDTSEKWEGGYYYRNLKNDVIREVIEHFGSYEEADKWLNVTGNKGSPYVDTTTKQLFFRDPNQPMQIADYI